MLEREKELAILDSTLKKCQEGSMQMTLVKGQPGTGKSFLMDYFLASAQDQDGVIVSASFCDGQIGEGRPYLPFRDLMTGFLNGVAAQQKDPKHKGLKKTMLFVTKALFDHAPDLIDLFIPAGGLINKIGKYALSESGLEDKVKQKLSTDKQQAPQLSDETIYEQYLNFLIQLSSAHTVVLFIDDLHWADEASINLLFRLIAKLKDHPVYFITSYRSNFGVQDQTGERHGLSAIINEWVGKQGDIILDLDVDSEEQKIAFLDSILDQEKNQISHKFRQQLVRATNGNALFMTEMIQSMKKSGKLARKDGYWVESESIDWDDMPARFEGIVQERVERLENSLRNYLSIASVQGNEFIIQVIAKIEGVSEREIVRRFTQELIQEHRLVTEKKSKRKGRQIISSFGFANTLTRQYLYNDLGQAEKMYLHEEIAKALEELYSDEINEVAQLLGLHYEMAGLSDKALEFYEKAANHAKRINAFNEASYLYKKALDQNLNMENSEEVLQKRMNLLIDFSVVLKSLKGWANQEVISLYMEAKELGIRLNNVSQTSPVLFGLWVVHLIHLELDKALINGKELNELATANDDEVLLIQSHVSLSNTYFWLGDLQKTKYHYEQVFEHYDESKHQEVMHTYGQDPRSIAYMFEILTLWLSGEYDEAEHRAMHGYNQMKGLEHTFSFSILVCTTTWLAFHNNDFKKLELYANELRKISEEHGFVFYIGLAKMFQGYLYEDEALIEEGYQKDFLASGGLLFNSMYVMLKTKLAIKTGTVTDLTEDNLNAAISMSRHRNELVYYPELVRLLIIIRYKTNKEKPYQEALDHAISFAKERGMVALQTRIEDTIERLKRSEEAEVN